MRRSAAPSQMAKRPKFSVPFKVQHSAGQVVESGEHNEDTAHQENVRMDSHYSSALEHNWPPDPKSSNYEHKLPLTLSSSYLEHKFLSVHSSLSSELSSKSCYAAHNAENYISLGKDVTQESAMSELGRLIDPLSRGHGMKEKGDKITLTYCNPNLSVSKAPTDSLKHKSRHSSDDIQRVLKPVTVDTNTNILLSPTEEVSLAKKNQTDPKMIISYEKTVTPHSRYFSVVWCKLSKKKHKKWEGDAVLIAHGHSVTLYDMDGKEIGRSSSYRSSELESLKEDETLVIGGKEIQIMSLLSEEHYKSGKCFSGASSAIENNFSPCIKSTGVSKSFANPLLKNKFAEELYQKLETSRTQSTAPRFDPAAPGALLMPRPSASHQWQNNKQQSSIVEVVVDPHLSVHLRPHQREGVTFLYECVNGMRNYGGTGAILADDMGLGKTLQCIALIWTLLKQGPYGGKPLAKRVLIITPGSLVKNWAQEFRQWLGAERLQVFAVTGDKKVEDYLKTALYPVMIISYEMFVRGYELIRKVPFDLVVCDEGHRLKNTAIKTTSLIASLDTCRRIVLSGTPVQNDLQEFFALVDFCNPGVLGSSAAFRRVYEEPILTSQQPQATKEEVELGEERAAELARLTRMFVLRRTQEINNRYLPSKVELVLFCRPSKLQKQLYREILKTSVVQMCLAGRGYCMGIGTGAPHLQVIAALKQLCNHPSLLAAKVLAAESTCISNGCLDDDAARNNIFARLASYFNQYDITACAKPEESGKLSALAQILQTVLSASPKEKIVLVSNHTKTLNLLQQFCNANGYSCVRLDGSTPTAQRQEVVTRFNNSYGQETTRFFCDISLIPSLWMVRFTSVHQVEDYTVLICAIKSSKAGGVGLNLIGASRLVLYDIDWNPANDLQAMARVWRDGQKRKVYIYRLLTTGSIEEKVYQRQISKQGLSGTVMDFKATDIQFSQEDLKDLFSLNTMTECDTHSRLDCQCEYQEFTQVPESLSPPPVLRPCQLGNCLETSTPQARNLSMAELLDWKHLLGSSKQIQEEWCLKNTQDAVSFIFWNETNTKKLKT